MIGPGEIVDGTYELRSLLGEGSAARVFRAFDRRLDRDVAIKFLIGRTPLAAPARFLEEARSLAEVRDPHVLQVLAFGLHQGLPFLVLELALGGSLADRLREGPLPGDEALALATEILGALRATHAAGVLHRDLKPANVLLTSAGRAKIADFGLAKRAESGIRTASGLILGTPEFMAPEVLQGVRAGEPADVYAWGCLAYMLVNGRPPFTGSIGEIARSHTTGSLLERGVESGPLASAIRRALTFDPTCRATVPELFDILSGRAAAPASKLRRTVAASREHLHLPEEPRPARSRRPLVLGGVALAATALLGVRAGLLSWSSGPSAASLAAVQAEQDRRILASWLERLKGVDLDASMPALHSQVLGQSSVLSLVYQPFPKLMHDARDGQADLVDLEALDRAREALPARELFQEARSDLARVLANTAVPLADRRLLWGRLLQLRRLDAYFEAWGRRAPYGAHRVLDGLIPLTGSDLGPVAEVTAEPTPGGVSPGRRALVFRWVDPRDQRYGLLFTEGSTGSLMEGVGDHLLEEFRRGGIDLDRHRGVSVSVTLAEGAAGARLWLHLSRMVLPYFLRLDWDSWPIEYHGDGIRAPGWQWMQSTADPGFLLEVGLPAELAGPGEHRLEIRLCPSPAVPRMGFLGLRKVVLEALGEAPVP